jgi:hypothetical protein
VSVAVPVSVTVSVTASVVVPVVVPVPVIVPVPAAQETVGLRSRSQVSLLVAPTGDHARPTPLADDHPVCPVVAKVSQHPEINHWVQRGLETRT